MPLSILVNSDVLNVGSSHTDFSITPRCQCMNSCFMTCLPDPNPNPKPPKKTELKKADSGEETSGEECSDSENQKFKGELRSMPVVEQREEGGDE